MTIKIPRSFIDFVLLGAPDVRRQLQDSPILGDVWAKYGDDPAGRHHLLITSHIEASAKVAAADIYSRLGRTGTATKANISFLQGVVAASLTFEELLRDVVPLTSWWHNQPVRDDVKVYRRPRDINEVLLAAVLHDAGAKTAPGSTKRTRLTALDRYAVLAGLILWAASAKSRIQLPPDQGNDVNDVKAFAEAVLAARPPIGDLLKDLLNAIYKGKPPRKLVFQISLNRKADAAIKESVLAVKGDAAKQLFAVDCSRIAWAVIDSGIDADHPAFKDKEKKSRVVQSYDFTRFRRIVSLSNVDADFRKETIGELKDNRTTPLPKDADRLLRELAEDSHAEDDVRGVNWDHVEKLVTLGLKDSPTNDHGTHVAGILGAAKDPKREDSGDGMCPDIKLHDFRVLAPTIDDTEFAIIGALQYIRQLNARHSFITIHGANLSLSIPHYVRNYACGRTPVCMACEQLVDSGVVVVAAAGNLGYHQFETRDGLFEGYAAFSITDPGNADGVITVGSTHRSWPHTYGVSFFSSRGPTGDGRSKPDLVAPGERIHAPVIDGDWGDLDGTSMAAPHVSGAAAMLMARNTELIGQPRRIKRLLCDTATDLGRERSFQGHGMLDVLRALQGI